MCLCWGGEEEETGIMFKNHSSHEIISKICNLQCTEEARWDAHFAVVENRKSTFTILILRTENIPVLFFPRILQEMCH